jgi:hypothetical protein
MTRSQFRGDGGGVGERARQSGGEARADAHGPGGHGAPERPADDRGIHADVRGADEHGGGKQGDDHAKSPPRR